MIATDSLVNAFGPWVVSERRPGALDKDRSRQGVAAFGDASVAVGFTGLVLARNESEVGGDLASVFEPVWIVETGNEDLGGPRSDTRNGPQAFNAFVLLTNCFEPLDDRMELFGKGIEELSVRCRVVLSRVHRACSAGWACETN